MQKTENKHSSSFRDPSGYIFTEGEKVYRAINPIYFAQYNSLKDTGFYNKAVEKGLLIGHDEVKADAESIILKPEQISFFSYPYEWSFSQYKHAALHTLKLQKYCLNNGYSLKDATAFNITYHNGRPIFVDTLSFDFYEEGEPWRAYRQFLMHFFAPLLLAKYFGNDMLKMLSQYIDGVPLDKVAAMLPFKARFSPVVYTNIFLTAKYDKKYSNSKGDGKKINITKASQIKILDFLYNYIKDMELNEKTEWKDYYCITNYETAAFEYKKKLVKEWFEHTDANKVIDLGGNDGTFSRILKEHAKEILVTDIDPNAVDQNYIQVLKNKEKNIIPLVSDLLNPSPGIGFNNEERSSLLERIKKGGFEVTMALALIHHISLTGNVPFDMSARFFASLTPYLIIEFPDREDSWVSFLLKSKRDFENHFDGYNLKAFEKEYSVYYDIIKKQHIPDTKRTMYLLKRK